MITCPKCNNQNQEGAKFCTKCGNTLLQKDRRILPFSLLITSFLVVGAIFISIRLWWYFYLIGWVPSPVLGPNAGQGGITFIVIGAPLLYLFYRFSSFLVKKFRQKRRTALIIILITSAIYIVSLAAISLLTPKDIAQILYDRREYELLIEKYPDFVRRPDVYSQIKSEHMEWTKNSTWWYGISFDIEDLEQLLQINTQDKEIRDRLGELYERSGLSRLKSIEDRNKMSGPGLMRETTNKQDLELAIYEFNKALQYNPTLKTAQEKLKQLQEK